MNFTQYDAMLIAEESISDEAIAVIPTCFGEIAADNPE